MKNESSFLNNCYEWLFSEEERKPLAYIVGIFVAIIISTVISLFIVAIDRLMDGWVQYMFN